MALEDEQPTFYDTEESATSIATTLNSLYKLTGVQAYVDVYKEEVKVIKVTNNSPSRYHKLEQVNNIQIDNFSSFFLQAHGQL